jgi:orotidine-5'-phosphate decarboxylase
MPHTFLLVPGYGAQGAAAADVAGAFDADGLGAVVNSSRGVIYAWERVPYSETHGESDWQDAVKAAAADMQREIWEATH